MTPEGTKIRLAREAIVAVVRGASPSDAVEVTEVLVGAGITVVEITYTTPEACAVVRELSQTYGDGLCVGVGTITTKGQVDDAVAAGAQFLVSPGCPPNLVEHMQAIDRLAIPGVFTPTDVMTVAARNVDVVKLFPADALGRPHLKALQILFPNVHFVPTGGIRLENVGEWFAAGALAVGIGEALVPPRAPDDRSRSQLRERAALFRAAVAAATERR